MIHRAHDYRDLTERWRRVARDSGLILRKVAKAGQFDVICLFSRGLSAKGGLYISAGIHGDEPGGTEGLIAWAERHHIELARRPLVIFPCLNPWGLVQNSRYNEDGRDLNRAFDHDDSEVVTAVRERLRGRRFDLALALHEDYDAQGIYLYEGVTGHPPCGAAVIQSARMAIEVDLRPRVDFGRPTSGIIRRRFDRRRQERLGGMPEAVYLQRYHADRTITFETPSEYGLDLRIGAHVRCIEACVEVIA